LGNGLRARGDCWELVVGNDADEENGLAGFDFVAAGEHGLLNLCAIQMGAVGAFLVDDAAAVGTALDGEVNAGHVVVVWDGEMGAVGGAADEHGLASRNAELLACKRPGFDFKNYAHMSTLSKSNVP